MSIIQFNDGSFSGDVVVEKVGSIRRGEAKIQLRVTRSDNIGVLLPKAKKICQAQLVVEGMQITVQGELASVATYTNGDAAIDLVVENDVWAQKLFVKVKEKGTATINFSSTKAVKPAEAEAEQPNLDGIGDDEDELG